MEGQNLKLIAKGADINSNHFNFSCFIKDIFIELFKLNAVKHFFVIQIMRN